MASGPNSALSALHNAGYSKQSMNDDFYCHYVLNGFIRQESMIPNNSMIPHPEFKFWLQSLLSS